MVITTSDWRASSAGDPAQDAPSCLMAPALSGRLAQTLNGNPARMT
jgi:hypothetical protein